MFDKNKLKNYGVWVAVFSALGMLLQDLNVYPDHYAEIINLVLTALVVLGILSNPEDGKWFKDPSKKDKDKLN